MAVALAVGCAAAGAQAPSETPATPARPHAFAPPAELRPAAVASPAVPPERAARALRTLPLANAGFETTAPGPSGEPDGWTLVQHAGPRSYLARADEEVFHSGRRSLRLENTGPERYGLVYQSLPAVELRGRTLRFSGWLSTRDVKGNAGGRGAGLSLQAQRGGYPAATADMKKDGVAGTTGWTRYEVVLTVPADADRIEVGLLLYGPGTAWLDDVGLDEIAARP